MRVLQFGADPLATDEQPHGAIFELDQAKILARTGHHVRLVSVGDIPRRYLGKPYPYPRVAADANLIVYRRYMRFVFGERNRLVPRERTVSASVALAQRVISDGFEPEIIHGHNLGGALAAAHLSRKFGIPYVTTEHRSSWLKPSEAARLARIWRTELLDVAAIACVGEALRRSFTANVPELSERIRVIPNVVDDRFFENARHQRPANQTRIAMLGYLVEHKGHHRAITAFAEVFAHDPTAELIIVGDGPERTRLVRLAHDLGVSEKIRWLGALPREDVLRVLSEVNCLLVASTVETFSVAAIEALASGIPVIATRCGGPEFFVRRSDGILVRDLSVEALVEALEEFESHRHRFEAESISRSCEARFGARAVAHQIESMWIEASDA